MRPNLWIAAVLACGLTTGLAAAGAAKNQAKDAQGKTVTLIGCVQNISRSEPGRQVEKGFLLSNATLKDAHGGTTLPPSTPPPAPAPLAVGTSGTAAAGMPSSLSWPAATGTAGDPTSSRASSSYVLLGHDGELKTEVGRKVEVTGTIEPAPQAAKGSSSTAPAVDAMASDSRRLEVTSLQVVASTCTSK